MMSFQSWPIFLSPTLSSPGTYFPSEFTFMLCPDRYQMYTFKCPILCYIYRVTNKKLIDTNCCQLCQKTLTNLVSFLTFCSSWSLQCISAGTAWKHQGPLGRKYSWQLSGQNIATSLKTDSGGSVGKRCIFCNVDFFVTL